MENREQLRAKHAYQKVTEISDKPEIAKKEYSSMAKKLPAMIQNNGLLASLSFLQAKKHNDLLSHLHAWLCQVDSGIPKECTVVVHNLVNRENSLDLLPLTVEAIAVSGWIKRMVESLIPEA